MKSLTMHCDQKKIFVVFPVFEDEIHNALYAQDLFLNELLSRGYSVTAMVFSERHKKIIKNQSPRLQIMCLSQQGFIPKALSWLRFLLAQLNVPRLPSKMKARWERRREKGTGLVKRVFRKGIEILAKGLGAERIWRGYIWLAGYGAAQKPYSAQRPFLTLLPFYCSRAEEMEVIAAAHNSQSLSVALPARISTADDVFFYARPDLLLVWNTVMREEILGWHGGDPDSVEPVGILKCDYYRRQDLPVQTREEFIRANGLDETRKIVSIICGNITAQRASALALELFKSKAIQANFQVLLRANPDEFEKQNESLAECEGFPIHLAKGFSSDVSKQTLRDQVAATAGFLKHSDVILSVASTMSIESLYFDVPNIFLQHDEFQFFYDYDWATDLLKEPGIKIVRNDTELIQAINTYLENPAADQSDREQLFRKYAFSIKGDAREQCLTRIACRLGPCANPDQMAPSE